MATVGVIIPAFNAAKTLPIALESVASQTFDDWQILLVDDGSTDNTAEVVAPFLTRFGPKILYAGWPRLWRHHQHRPGWQARRIVLGESSVRRRPHRAAHLHAAG